MNERISLPDPDRDRTLHEVCHDLAASLRPSGRDGEIDEWSVYDESFRRLLLWAKSNECFYEGLQPFKEGGREHDLTFDDPSRSWLKFTKPSSAGYCVSFDLGYPTLEPSLPLEYLERLLLQNEIFADSVSFVGLAGESHKYRIITRQEHVDGRVATLEEIIFLMTENLGFTLLPHEFSVGYADSLAFIREDIAVFDMRPANVVRGKNGVIVPIDMIPCRLNSEAREILRV